MSGLEETILIECSRNSSIEGGTRNFTTLAEWTCNTGDGVVLDIGDKIELHSGFVSETGAQSGEIEIKERDRAQTFSTTISKQMTFGSKNTPVPTLGDVGPIQENIYEYAAEFGGEEIFDFPINDGETNVIYSPYKTTNGEFYASLPRRHIGWNGSVTPQTETTDVWNTYDAQFGARTAFNAGAGIVGNTVFTPSGGMDVNTPVQAYPFPENPWQFVPKDYKLTAENTVNWTGTFRPTEKSYRKGMIRNDCSRYTIFRMDQLFRSMDAAINSGTGRRDGLGGAATDIPEAIGTPEYQNAVDIRDPAVLANWTQVREVIKLKSKAGFNTPTDVAEEITQQLNLREDLEIEKARTGGGPSTPPNPQVVFTQDQIPYYSSPAIKPYNCASSAWDATRWQSFRQVKNTSTSDLDDAHFYMSMYQHIGVKRPELWIQGRKTNTSLGFLKPSVGAGSNSPTASQCLNLAIPWTQENLENLNDLFNIQGQYPELFDSEITQMGLPGLTVGNTQHNLQGVDKHRFLHFNGQDDATDVLLPGVGNHFPVNSLGYDCYGPREGEALPANYSYSERSQSYPVFFDYNKDRADLRFNDVGYTEDANGGISDYNDLAYGWARKMRFIGAGGVDEFYIGVQFTLTGNRIPEYLFNLESHIAKTGLGKGRRFGFDYHFSAFGSACINLYSGVIISAKTGQADEGESVASGPGGEFRLVNYENSYMKDLGGIDNGLIAIFDTAPFYRQLLLGADSPALSFNSDTSRFSFSNLHIAERLSNIYNAGQVGVDGSAVPTSIPANANSGQVCYKINKSLLGNSYCPNMAPYTLLAIPADREMPAQLMLSNNFEPWQPYDVTCGLFIEQIAVPEEIWDENLMGVLGFQYEQFSNTDKTRQVVINNRRDSSNQASLTTQAPISAGDIIEWTKNGFGNSIYSLTPPMAYTRRFTSLATAQADSFKNIFPPATIFPSAGDDSFSTKITALQLPTKTARPYYTIRSDIVPRSAFIGGNQDLVKSGQAVNRPVISVVNKINGYGDFYSQQDNQIVFTNTEKRVITSIKTSVHDPDGSYSKVNKNSSVIYKITKMRNVDLTPVSTLLESKKKADQLAGQAAVSMLKDLADAVPNYSQTFAFQALSKEGQ